ncbi:hypothetical protein FS837_011380 [Tulasnella sp. UAMH 9824]|nr:hypothetical protein FS837_011380 [Tulasnella sp. UAMH 9824]
MPAVPQNIISDVTELILTHIRENSQELQVAPHRDGKYQSQLQAVEGKINVIKETLTGVRKTLNTRIGQRKKRRNSLTRFNQLPLEIASHILWLSIVDPWSQKDSYSFVQRQQTISRVCSSWRTLVEDSPLFWSIIEFSSPLAAISHLLEKSQSSGLEIKSFSDRTEYGYVPTYLSEDTQRQCFISITPHAERIRSLILSLHSPDGLGMVLEKPAPMLEELKLNSVGSYNVRAFDMFCGQASRLRDVALRNIAVKWDSGVFIGLRTLRIVENDEYLPTEEQIRQLLEANPRLEKLEIGGVPFTERFGNDAVQSTGQRKSIPVVMSKMQELRLLFLPFKLVKAVLGTVEIPSISYLEFMCMFQDVPTSTKLDPTVKHLVSTLLRLSKGTQQVELTLRSSSVGLAIYTPRHDGPTVRIELIENLLSNALDWLIENLFHAEGLPSICAPDILQVSLKFGEDFNMGGGRFIPILDRLNAVKVKALTMERWCNYGEELIKYLGEVKGDSQWPLPYLTSMTIVGPALLADHLLIALQRRMQKARAGETPAAPQPVMLDVLDIEGLDGVDEDVEKALAKCVASRGTFISKRRKQRPISPLFGSEDGIFTSGNY